MQVFLPYPDFVESARCLDYRRLGKQRVENSQILDALYGIKIGWKNHPAVHMFKGHEESLKLYMNICIEEWKRRGYKNTMEVWNLDESKIVYPKWFGNEDFHSAHRAALLAKDFGYYLKFNWKEEPKIEYIWPKGD
ncbi:MAG: pyrimidine dimer DNA glycosylase/endonuclease V [Candidatus Shapirobacteria bacterium]